MMRLQGPDKEPIRSISHARLGKPRLTNILNHSILCLDIVRIAELDDRDSKLSNTLSRPIICSYAFPRRSK
jgi:hypothetical protein